MQVALQNMMQPRQPVIIGDTEEDTDAKNLRSVFFFLFRITVLYMFIPLLGISSVIDVKLAVV